MPQSRLFLFKGLLICHLWLKYSIGKKYPSDGDMGYYMAYYLFPFQKVDHLLYVLVTEYRPTILTKFGSSLRSEKAGTVLHNIFRGGGRGLVPVVSIYQYRNTAWTPVPPRYQIKYQKLGSRALKKYRFCRGAISHRTEITPNAKYADDEVFSCLDDLIKKHGQILAQWNLGLFINCAFILTFSSDFVWDRICIYYFSLSWIYRSPSAI